MLVQVPVPDVGTFPAMLVPVALQRFWVGPALEEVAGAELVMVTVLVEAGHMPLTMLHWKM